MRFSQVLANPALPNQDFLNTFEGLGLAGDVPKRDPDELEEDLRRYAESREDI